MHVRRLHRDERTQPGGVLQNHLRHQPGVNQAVVGVDENSLAATFLTPAGDLDHVLQV